METCNILVERFGGEVPRSRADLESPARRGPQDRQRGAQRGLRRADHGGGHAHLPAGNRTGLAPGKTPLEVEQKLLQRIPGRFMVDAHHWLILHGRYICQARKPQCWNCGVSAECDFDEKTPAPR